MFTYRNDDEGRMFMYETETGERVGSYAVRFLGADQGFEWEFTPANAAKTYTGQATSVKEGFRFVETVARHENNIWKAWVEQAEQYAREAHSE